ncbi:MAG TPA: hypothetical protein VK858_06780 [Longimicrobiales bacterium]|nr:hypothetical protein [Longimicrobiales bacterium]
MWSGAASVRLDPPGSLSARDVGGTDEDEDGEDGEMHMRVPNMSNVAASGSGQRTSCRNRVR